MSPLKIVTLQETFPRPVPAGVQAELERRHPGHRRFGHNGFLAVLQKAE